MKQASGGLAEEDLQALRQDIDLLDGLDGGLAAATLGYVATGANAAVLLTLRQHSQQLYELIGKRGFASLDEPWLEGRWDYIRTPRDWRPDVLRRYAQLLATAAVGQHYVTLPGTERSPDWFRTILLEYGRSRLCEERRRHAPSRPDCLNVARLAELLDQEGLGLLPILDVAFEKGDRPGAYRDRWPGPERMADFWALLAADPAARAADIGGLSASARGHALRSLARRGLVDGAWFELAFEQAADRLKPVRDAAILVLRAADPALLMARTEASFAELAPPRRIELARSIAIVGGVEGSLLLGRLLAAEPTPSVAAELRHLLGQRDGAAEHQDGPEGYAAVDGTWVSVPPAPALPEDIPVSAELRRLVEAAFAAWRDEDERYNDQHRGTRWFTERIPPAPDAADRFCRLAGPEGETLSRAPGDAGVKAILGRLYGPERVAIQAKTLAHPDLTLWHLMRIARDSSAAFDWLSTIADAVRSRLKAAGGFRPYADICCRLGKADDELMRFLLTSKWHLQHDEDWLPEHVWPYCARHFGLMDEALGLAPPSGAERFSEYRMLRLLAFFPKTPARYRAALIERAIGGHVTVRGQSRALLERVPGLDELLFPLLEHPKQETRADVAGWLAERGSAAALPKLIEAARKEAMPSAKAACLRAIARLGGDTAEFLSAEALVAEARTGLKRLGTSQLDWFPFEAMPPLRQRCGALLDPLVVRWWLVLAARLKEPGGNAWFDLLLDQLEPECAERLGSSVLSAWIAFDSVQPSDAEANAHAEAEVKAWFAQSQRPVPDARHGRLFAMLRKRKLAEYPNSGKATRGILALATRAAGSEALALVRAYYRDHYRRTAQSKALIECLAANPAPVAIQFVAAIARRWRKRQVQEHARALIEALAARRGWTAEELADRTIPTGGFGRTGVLSLPIGERTYTARLDERNEIRLLNPAGKAVRSLPSGSDGLAAKTLLAAARQEVRQVFELQPKRLYEALCAEREWRSPDWAEQLLGHPVAGRLAQRLIWLGLDQAGRLVASFRPLEDLSLTDAGDRAVDAEAFCRIRLAHRLSLDPQELPAWHRHFADYDVVPLFDQLARPALTLGNARTEETEITDRRGWVIDAFKLRSAAGRLGYGQGELAHGGYFSTYEKPFGALGLNAVVHFTGNIGLNEQNRLTALLGLRFERRRGGGTAQPIALHEVPRVLLSEAWNDFHAIAAAGTGYAEDWIRETRWC